MRVLLDTHVFLWYINKDRRLSKAKREFITDIENDVFLSVISVWEGVLKWQLKKLSLPEFP